MLLEPDTASITNFLLTPTCCPFDQWGTASQHKGCLPTIAPGDEWKHDAYHWYLNEAQQTHPNDSICSGKLLLKIYSTYTNCWCFQWQWTPSFSANAEDTESQTCTVGAQNFASGFLGPASMGKQLWLHALPYQYNAIQNIYSKHAQKWLQRWHSWHFLTTFDYLDYLTVRIETSGRSMISFLRRYSLRSMEARNWRGSIGATNWRPKKRQIPWFVYTVTSVATWLSQNRIIVWQCFHQFSFASSETQPKLRQDK